MSEIEAKSGTPSVSSFTITRANEPVYVQIQAGSSLRQGELITGLKEYQVDMSKSTNERILEYNHEIAIVLTQDCDLAQEINYSDRRSFGYTAGHPIPNILFALVYSAESMKSGMSNSIGSKAWDRIKKNDDKRYQFLEQVPPNADVKNTGLPEMVIDFKRVFSVPLIEVYNQISRNVASRRTRLDRSYRDHFQHRFITYLGRVGLELDHLSE